MSDDPYAKYANAEPGDNLLKQIAATALEVLQAQEKVAEREAELKRAQAALRVLEEEKLPELMQMAGQTAMTTADNLAIEVKDVVRASIPQLTANEAFKWLRDNGHSAVIKNNLAASFSRQQDELATEAFKLLEEKGMHPSMKAAVNPSTLAALVRELLPTGKLDTATLALLGAHVTTKAIVKPKK